jgi:hypothetical protein
MRPSRRPGKNCPPRARARRRAVFTFRLQPTQQSNSNQTETPLDLCTHIVYNTTGNFNCR